VDAVKVVADVNAPTPAESTNIRTRAAGVLSVLARIQSPPPNESKRAQFVSILRAALSELRLNPDLSERLVD
jgi:hypothetical protein